MIKIIISGTSDGFYPRYSSDGVLDDKVSQCLLDRRRFLSRNADRLYREGYSFQPLEHGIMYHKLMLLYDGFGRDGFVMASLFLPEGDSLSGKDIKDALDSILKELKAHTVNGMANFELDWSFVKRKADELNQSMVKQMPWAKKTGEGGKSRTALIDVPDSRVADYFQYPNPVHSVFTYYEQVFLTVALLDSNMVSDNGEHGYKVLTTNDVDIDDVEYIIVYNREKGKDERLDVQNETIRKHELESCPGDYKLGTLSKAGYRSADVIIKDKISPDGCTVTAILPVLTPKYAKVTLEMVEKDTGNPILSNFDVCLSDDTGKIVTKYNDEPAPIKLEFTEEYCDREWALTASCKQYQPYGNKITVGDGMDKILQIELDIKPLWSVYFRKSEEEGSLICSGISDDMLEHQVKSSKEWLENQGLKVEKCITDNNSHKIIICCNKEQYPPLTSELYSRSTIDQKTENKTVYFLRLNKESKDYSLFKNYRYKLKYKSDLIDALKKLAFSGIDEIEEALKNDKYSIVRNKLKDVKGSNEILQILKKIERIPNVVSEKTGITYNWEEHRLECVTSNPPLKEPKFASDKYKYWIGKCQWVSEEEANTIKYYTVKRTLRPIYKTSIVVGIIAVAAVVIACLIGPRSNAQYAEICDEFTSFKSRNSITEEYSRYIGDTLLNEIGKIKGKVDDFKQKHKGFEKDSVFDQIGSLYNKQFELQKQDSMTYIACMNFINDPATTKEVIDDWEKIDSCEVLSVPHREELSQKAEEKKQQLDKAATEAEKKTEADLFNQCSKDNLSNCKVYYDTYSKNPIDQGHLDTVKVMMNEVGRALYNTAKDEEKSEQDRNKACKDYLQYADYFTELFYKTEIKEIEKKLSSQQTDGGSAQNTIIIGSLRELEAVLSNPDVVANGWTKFQNKYSFPTDNKSKSIAELAKNIVNAACADKRGNDWKEKKNNYEDTYASVKKSHPDAGKDEVATSIFLRNLLEALQKK